MIIGVCTVQLHIPESNSLKTKRHYLKSIKDKIRNRFNVSVAEVENQDLWQRATLGIAVVSGDTNFANKVLSQVINLIEEGDGVILLDYSIEMI